MTCDFEPESCDGGAEGLTDAAEEGGPEHSFPAAVDGEVERECEGEAFSDVVDEEGEEDGEAECGVGVIGGVGDEAFGNFVEGDSAAGLEADGEEDVGRDVVVMLLLVGGVRVIVVIIVRVVRGPG